MRNLFRPSPLLNTQKHVGLFPEAFEIIKFALFITEDVNQHVAVIHQHPAALRFPFDGDGQTTMLLFDRLAHAIGQCLDLAVAVTCANDEKIGDNCIGA